MDSLIAAGYDGHLTAFDVLLPPLFAAYDALPSADPRRADLKEAIETLRAWNRRTSADSVATAVAIFWGQGLIERNGAAARDADEPVYDYLVDKLTDAERIEGLTAALAQIAARLRPLADRVGRDQSLPALDRRHRAAV